MKQTIEIDRETAHAIVALIGEYQNCLESELDGLLVPGENQPVPRDRAVVNRLRKDWWQAENLIKTLEAARGKRA